MFNATPLTFFVILVFSFAIVGTLSFFVGDNFKTGSSTQGAIVGDISRGTILEVKIVSTNDTFSRYIGVTINKPLEKNWWNGNRYTCNFVVRPSYVGNTFTCELNEPYNFSQTSISSDAGYLWNIQVTYKNQVYTCSGVDQYVRCPSTVSPTTTTTAITKPSINYKVCTYANPNAIGGGLYLNGKSYANGQTPEIQTGVLYTLSPISVDGYQFDSWTTSNGVSVSESGSQNTTVVFSSSSWDGTCVGTLTANYVLQSTTSTTTTTVAPSINFTCSGCNTGKCMCATSCSGGIANFYLNSSCSGTPFRQFTFSGGNFTFNIASTTYAQILCDNGQFSYCKMISPTLAQQ